jgi:hypothetical protein
VGSLAGALVVEGALVGALVVEGALVGDLTGALVGDLTGALVGAAGGHVVPIAAHVPVSHSVSSLQHWPVPGLTHSLSEQRLPPVHWASVAQLALMIFVTLVPKDGHLFATKALAHVRAASSVLPAQNRTHRFVQSRLDLSSRRDLPSSSSAPARGMSSAFERPA